VAFYGVYTDDWGSCLPQINHPEQIAHARPVELTVHSMGKMISSLQKFSRVSTKKTGAENPGAGKLKYFRR
jgi:hypothetical protein